MLSITKLVATGVLLAVVSACAGSGVEVPASAARAVGDVFVTANVVGVGGTNASGTVRLIDLPTTDDTQVQVELMGIPTGPHAWHIHSGTCAMPGAIVVPFTTAGQRQGVDEPINAGADMRASADAMVPASMLSRQAMTATPHIVNIHSMAGGGPAIACAELR